MEKNFLADYAAFSLLKVFGPVIRFLPREASFSLGRLIGDLVFLFDLKHRAIVYANLRTAFSGSKTPAEIRKTAREFFRSFGQNIIEVFLVPLIDSEYMRRYVRIEGLENIEAAFAAKKGVILCSVHAGSWELANILSANLGFPFSMFVRDLKFPKVEGLLNSYRKSKGCRLIQRQNQTRELIRVLKNNESTGMSVDQGGRTGTLVSFFGREASMSSGGVRLAMKYGCSLVPVFLRRVKGPYLHIRVGKPFELRQTGDPEADVTANLQSLISLFEGHVREFPNEYLWSYKVWKYAKERKILILSDGKTGHLRQSQALAEVTAECLAQDGIRSTVTEIGVAFKSGMSRRVSSLLNIVSGRHICRGCLLCLRGVLEPESYRRLIAEKFDVIISCGSSLSAPNYILSRENEARSFVIMRPSLAELSRFDLVVIPEHDDPPAAANVVRLAGALNLVTVPYLEDQARQLREAARIDADEPRRRFGLLIGGDTKEFSLRADVVREVCGQLKRAAERAGAELFVTTSRRTAPGAEAEVTRELRGSEQCRMLVIANKANQPFVVGGILGICGLVVCSPESISMISEAASSGAYVIVFRAPGVGRRHRKFLERLVAQGNIFLVEPSEIAATVERIVSRFPVQKPLNDRKIAAAAVRKVIR